MNLTGSAIDASSRRLGSVSVLRLPAVQSASILKRVDSQPSETMIARNRTAEMACCARVRCLVSILVALHVEALDGQPQEERSKQDVVGDVCGVEHAAAQAFVMAD